MVLSVEVQRGRRKERFKDGLQKIMLSAMTRQYVKHWGYKDEK